MLGYSRDMHKIVAATLGFLFAGLTTPIAVAAPQTRPPLLHRAPTPIPPPETALKAAFESAGRGALDDIALAAFASHPLAGWLEFVQLRAGIDTLPIDRGNRFLTAHKGEPVAMAFRDAWLPALARRNAWPSFLAHWDATLTSPLLRCLRLQALMASNRVDAEWTKEAQALWRNAAEALPAQCDAPLALLAAQGGLPVALRWERYDKAAEAAQTAVMRSIAQGLPAAEQAQATAYAAYIDAPSDKASGWPANARSRLVASVALARLAKSSPDRAEALLSTLAQPLAFTPTDSARVQYQLALWSAASYLPEAARRLAAVPDAAWDASLHETQVREALARSDWAAALAAIQRMPEAQRNDSRWLYFAARMHALGGNDTAARALFARAAEKPDFHGFLAADRLDLPYALCPWLPAAALSQKQAIANDPGIVRALQLHMLDRKGWATREWDAALARFTDEQRRIAVEVAQDNGWFDRGVFSLINVNGKRLPAEQQLYLLRFPLHHAETIRREALRNRLDPAWIAAEIRAESVFDPMARSSANARGLMQVLPSTGEGLAKALGLPWTGADSLYDPDTNILLGSAYLRQLMDRYGGKPYQVIAGYNAGPAPLNRWLSQRPNADPDIWIETISYRETREYVARVLSFSTLYDWRLNGDAMRLSNRLAGIEGGPRKRFACPQEQLPKQLK